MLITRKGSRMSMRNRLAVMSETQNARLTRSYWGAVRPIQGSEEILLAIEIALAILGALVALLGFMAWSARVGPLGRQISRCRKCDRLGEGVPDPADGKIYNEYRCPECGEHFRAYGYHTRVPPRR